MKDNRLTKFIDDLIGRSRLHHGRGGRRRYLTGTGQALIHVHPKNAECVSYPCVIHNPSPEAKAIGPTHYSQYRRRMERVLPDGTTVPDPDSQAWARRMGYAS